jgi:hypothetical protein
MASQNNINVIDPMLLDGDTIVVDHPGNAIDALPSLVPLSSPPSSTPSTPSLIETIPLRRFSYVWNHMPDPNPQTIYKDAKGNRQWRCMYCTRHYVESGGTRVISNHLKSTHRITVHSTRQEQRDRVAGSIEQAMENACQSTGFKRRRAIIDLIDESDSEPPKGKY